MDAMMMGAMSEDMKTMDGMEMKLDMAVMQACMDACMEMKNMMMAAA